jgi:hypothetical protein
MNEPSTVRRRLKSNTPTIVFIFFVSFVFTGMQSGCKNKDKDKDTATLASNPAAAPRPLVRILVCPTLGSSLVPSPSQSQEKGGHSVTLSWRPGVAADSQHEAAVGYCVYRGIKHNDALPQLINSKPFPGTTCMDDWVENGKKYYYVVRAIGSRGTTSVVSNERAASIPTGGKRHPSVSASPAPFCRQQ